MMIEASEKTELLELLESQVDTLEGFEELRQQFARKIELRDKALYLACVMLYNEGWRMGKKRLDNETIVGHFLRKAQDRLDGKPADGDI